ncbi:MAG: Bifunctional protein GlmU [Candidatus Woesearchaeota archaeon]|nr:Bifunctional protein GlmU [Candidatus Woesearchaeota archaeon]
MEGHLNAVILAGGLGTRLRPLTDNTPKPLLPIKGKPILLHIIENLKKYGVKDIVLAVCFEADKIKDYFGDGSKFKVNVSYCIEKEPLGTGGAIKLASRDFSNRFIALNGDNLGDFDYDKMLNFHKKNNAKVTIALYPVEDVTQFGIADLDENRIRRFIEKPCIAEAPTNLNNAGAYIFEPEVMDSLPSGKCSIERDCFEKLAPKGEVFGFEHEGQWFPTDNIERYNLANKRWKSENR